MSQGAVRVKLARWGNSLAVRLPAAWVREMGLEEGETLELVAGPTGELTLRARAPFDRAAFVAAAARLRATLPVTSDVVADMRREERY